MKKITSVIAIVLLAALIFTGCDFIPTRKDFSQYGFTFSIAGEVTEKEGNLNTKGLASLDTKYGTMIFTKMVVDLGITESAIAKVCQSTETIGQNGRFYVLAPEEDTNGVHIWTYYFVEDAEGTTWNVTCFTPEEDFNASMIKNVYKSIKFVNAE